MFDFNEYLNAHRTYEQLGSEEFLPNLPIIKCADGLELSAQASKFHYSDPRDNALDYTKVEIGFPSEVVDELMEYAETPSEPTETVYGYVPVQVLNDVVNKHGGLA